MGLKQARSWFVFPREFFVSGVTCSARAPSVALVWRLETAAWRHRESSPLQSLNSWLRYGFGTVLDPLRWLVSSWESSGPASRSALRAFERAVTSSWAPESCKREERELADAPRLFNCPVWTPPTGGWSNQIVRMGRSPTHVHGFLGPCPLVIWYLIQCER